MKKWYVYIVECNDETFYTGCTVDVNKRVLVHNKGKGAIYTKNRRPVTLRWFTEVNNRSEATKLEIKIKKLSRDKKIYIIKNGGSNGIYI